MLGDGFSDRLTQKQLSEFVTALFDPTKVSAAATFCLLDCVKVFPPRAFGVKTGSTFGLHVLYAWTVQLRWQSFGHVLLDAKEAVKALHVTRPILDLHPSIFRCNMTSLKVLFRSLLLYPVCVSLVSIGAAHIPLYTVLGRQAVCVSLVSIGGIHTLLWTVH